MKVEIKGNPGTGNTYINIGTVQNFNPNATTVINNNYGMRVKSQGDGNQDGTEVDKDKIKAHILRYVGKLKDENLVSEDWKKSYEALWNDILELKEVEETVYDHGNQHGTDFNRVLVAAIINILRDKGVYVKCTNVTMALALERSKDHHVRMELGIGPSEEVKTAVKQLIQDKKYRK